MIKLRKKNIFDDERKENFFELYISNIDKRLRDLEQPKPIDCKRWVWELIQNAKDSIVGQNNRKDVDIEIIVKGDIYIFRHNGEPFIKKTLYGLLYKYSNGKGDNAETTGRFGTGFLTTHSLSKIVEIKGDINMNGKTEGFSIVMNREGEGEELLKGLNETEESYETYEEPFGWTSYKYLVKTEGNKDAGRLGIQSFKDNITKVMLFCPEIRSVKLDNNGEIITIERNDAIDNLKGECKKLILNINEKDKRVYTRNFIYIKYDENNDQLNERFKKKRNLKICCAIELDNDNNIFVDESSPCLFSSLPFVGSEKHKLPFIINSQNFEPDPERQSILLHGKEINEKTGKISDEGINKMILSKSQKLYENLLECLCENDIIKKRYYLARGLTSIPEDDEIQNFDHDWYEKEFVHPMRNILKKYPILWNGEQYIKLVDAHLPIINYKSINIQKQAYDFISQIYDKSIPIYDEFIQYKNYIWKGDKNIKYTRMEECIKYISSLKTMDVLSEKIENAWEWIDKFLVFNIENESKCLKKYNIIPNMNLDFVKFEESLASSKDVPDNMIECMEKLDIPWKLNHIHKNIEKFNSGINHNIEFAVSLIKNKMNEWNDKILILISYIPKDNEDQSFVQKRQTIYELCSEIFKNMPQQMDGSSFPKELWNGIDEIVFKKLIEKIEKQGHLGGYFSIKYMKKFLNCISVYYSELNKYSIIPNQNGQFCKADELYEDIHIPDLFKECMNTCFNYDIKKNLIDNKLLPIKSLSNVPKMNISSVNISYYFTSNTFDFKNKQEAARYLIRIIPKETNDNDKIWQNDQRKLFNIYKIFCKPNIKYCEYCEIEDEYCNPKIWEYANNYICDEIITIIQNCNNVNELINKLNINNIDKKYIFEYLNVLYKFKKNKKIVPNQYEEFCYLKDLYNEGITNIETKNIEMIPEELKDIAKDLNYDVRKYLIHKNIDRICRDCVSEKEVNEKIAKLIEENNNNPNKRSDPKFKDVTNSLNEYNFEKIRNNLFSDEFMYIFGKMYISNISNRLRELESPSDTDCKRWIWELIQNAKDSIVGQNDRKDVDIEILIDGDKYIFKHNGLPFTKKTLPALLYKFTEGKANNSESTGRFGTGFLTTHSLSKVVKISSFINIKEEIKKFNVTIFREGEKEEELLEGLTKTKNSYREFSLESESEKISEKWTSYEYIIKTEENKKAGRLGIENFKDNINKVMLFCPEIRSIKLNNNGEIHRIERGNYNNNLLKGCEMLTLYITDGDKHFNRSFLYKKIEERNEALSERFKTNNNLRICCAIEIDDKNNIFVDESSPCLYCSLPLVGSEKHKLPYIINSQNFEPNMERQSILLHGKEINEKTGKISDEGINKMILSKSQKLYENLLECLCENDIIKKRYYLARGLTSIPEDDEIQNFDHDWYEKEFVHPMRNILKKYPILWNGEQYIKLVDAHLPIINYKSINIQKQAYDFISQIYDKSIPIYDEFIQYKNYIWKGDKNIKYTRMEECVQYLSELKDMNTLSEKISLANRDKWKWINDFLLFIYKNERNFLNIYNIIPNMNLDFVKLSYEISTSIEVPDNMIECIEKLELPWKKNHIHKNIYTICSIVKDEKIKDAVSLIKNKMNEWNDKILILISYIPEDNEDQIFVQKRRLIYKLCSKAFNMPSQEDGNSFPKELWNGIDEIVFKKLIEVLEKKGQLGGYFNIEYIKDFLKLVPEYLYRYHSVVPNKNGKFCKADELYEDIHIPELFKECMSSCFNYDIKKHLIDDELLSIKSLTHGRERKINDYIDEIKNYFIKEKELKNKQKAAKYLIRIIPKETNDDHNIWQNIQRKLFDIYKIFCEPNIQNCEIENEYCDKEFWKDANYYICKEIISNIEKYKNIKDLDSDLKINNEEKIFEYLNIIFKFTSEGKAIPNQNNEFCYLIDLKKERLFEHEIPDELKDISKDLGIDVRHFLLHPKVEKFKNSEMETYSYRNICEEIDDMIKKKISFSENYSDLTFKRVIDNLVEIYFDKIDDDELLKKYFPYTYSERESIILKVLYNKETRKNMTKLGKVYEEDKISKLLENNYKEVIDMIINEENPENLNNIKECIKYISNLHKPMPLNLSNNSESNNTLTINLDDIIFNMNNNIYSYGNQSNNCISSTNENIHLLKSSNEKSHHILSSNKQINSNNTKSISINFYSGFNDNEKIFIRDTFNEVIRYNYDFYFNSSRNKITGLNGEVYIYELLLRSNQFESVEWTMQRKEGYGQKFDCKGKTYFIDPEDGSHYDIIAKAKDGRQFYIEVKSTSYEFCNNKVPFYLSKMQIETMKRVTPPNEYILAIVFDVMNNPKHFFMNLRENILYNINCNNETFEFIVDLEEQYGKQSIIELFKNDEIINIIEEKLKNSDEQNSESNDNTEVEEISEEYQ